MTPLPESIENPHLLPLLLLAFLPLILHILDRRRARVVEWPAMRFLIPRSLGRVQRLRRREALLISLRTALILAIAGALLRPASTEERPARREASGSRGVVIAIDSSLSMAYREAAEGPSGLEKARDAALQVLDEASPGDRVALVAPQGRGEGGAGALLELDAARRAVRDTRPAGGSFRLLEALDRAADLLVKLPAGSREVYIFTDLQAGILPDRDPGRLRFIRDRLRAAGAPPALRLIDCGAVHPWNRFVASIDAAPLAIGTDEPAELRAAIEVSGEAPPGGPIPVRLLVDGVEAGSATAELEAGGKGTVLFAHRFSASGAARVSVALPADGLAEDDSRHAVLEVLDRVRVEIAGTTLDGAGPGTARYVELALAPRAGDLAAPPLIFRPRFSPRLDPGRFEGCRAVVITGIPRLDAETASLLERFVRGGGGLLLFAGEETDAASVTEGLFRDGRGILPARLLPRAAGAAGAAAVAAVAAVAAATGAGEHPRDVATGHPALSIFKDPEEGDLTRITILRWTRTADLTPDASVLARIDAASPWILERPAGKGKVVLVTTSAALDDSDLPRTPLFLPLVHRLLRHLATRDAAERSVLAGQPISVALPAEGASAEAQVIDPRGERLAARIDPGEGRPVAVFGETEVPGFYELRVPLPGVPDERPAAVFASNVPPEESRLERLGEDALSDLRAALGLEVSRDVREAAGSLVMARVKREHWTTLIAIATILLFVEQLLARTFAGGRAPRSPPARAEGKETSEKPGDRPISSASP